MTEFMKIDNSELEEFFSEEELQDLETPEVDHQEETQEEPQPEVQPKKIKPMAEPEKVAPTSYEPVESEEETLEDFLRRREYEQSEEYKVEGAKKKALEEKIKDKAELDKIKAMSTLSGDSLNHITLLDTSKIAKPAPAHFLNNNPTYQVALNQSAYIAHMTGLKFPDVFNINSSVSNDYESHLKKYTTYYDKIAYSSIGLKSFEEFAAMTSLFDVDTLAFGILNQTFPGKIKYNITCRHCNQTMNEVAISNDTLITVKDEEVYRQVGKVISSIDSTDKADEYSLVNKVTRIQLEESKTILDIRIPTVQDHLNVLAELRSAAQEEEYQRSSNYLLFVKAAYVLDPKESLIQGRPVFVEYVDRVSILDIVRSFSIADAAQANEYIDNKEYEYHISYAIPSFPCRNCKKEVGDVNIEVDELLFLESVQRFIK